jgi:hypothetical protein
VLRSLTRPFPYFRPEKGGGTNFCFGEGGRIYYPGLPKYCGSDATMTKITTKNQWLKRAAPRGGQTTFATNPCNGVGAFSVDVQNCFTPSLATSL